MVNTKGRKSKIDTYNLSPLIDKLRAKGKTYCEIAEEINLEYSEVNLTVNDISRHHGYDVLQGYMQLSDKHVKSEYTRGLSFNKPEPKPKEPKPDKTPKPIIEPQIPHTTYLEMKLIEKLALGEISSDAYSHAILKLKQNNKDSDINGYS